MKNLFHKGLCLVMALCCIAFKGYAGGGTLPDAQGHDLKLSYSRTTLKTVADAITQQVGIVFSYEIALADYPMENLYVTEQGAALDAILKTVFTPRGIDYRVVDKVVVLTRSAHPAQTVRAAPAKAQVTGVVRDAAGNPMIGVTVTIKGTLVGVSTGVDGSYTIPTDKDAMLLFSYIGYRNQEELVGQRTQIDVTMQEDQLVMDEVVVVGYGTLKKRNIVGAVENLAGDAVENRPNADITRSLQGQIPGLNIVQTDGKAAHGGQVTIRGVNNSFKARVNDGQKENKLGQGGSALVLIDGAGQAYCEQYVGFPDCSVDRIVPPVKSENPIDVVVERFFEWNVERAAFKGAVPEIPGMNPANNLIAYIERKLFTLNTGHAITAYLGRMKGYMTICQSISDEQIHAVVKAAMRESGRGLVARYGFDRDAHFAYIDKIIGRFTNPYLCDDVTRVGREPLRKLSAGDRLVKPVLTARQYGIGTPNLLLGIGAALHYDNPEDPQSVEMIAMTARLGAAAAVAEIAELPAGDPLPALAAQAYAEVERIIR